MLGRVGNKMELFNAGMPWWASAILACVLLWRLLSGLPREGELSSLRWSLDVLVEISIGVAVARLSRVLWYVLCFSVAPST
jgi:hypothetical protein